MVSCSRGFIPDLIEFTVLVGTALTGTILPRTVFARIVTVWSGGVAMCTVADLSAAARLHTVRATASWQNMSYFCSHVMSSVVAIYA